MLASHGHKVSRPRLRIRQLAGQEPCYSGRTIYNTAASLLHLQNCLCSTALKTCLRVIYKHSGQSEIEEAIEELPP